MFPHLSQIATKITLPIEDRKDEMIWKSNCTGELSFKDAFLFKTGTGQNINWAKTLRCPNIPPSESLLVCRLLLKKLPTDENLSLRDSYLPSMCSSCHSQVENSLHLFFDFSFALKLWFWLASILNISI